jgi:hypothetical protein
MKFSVFVILILFCGSVIAHPRDSAKMVLKQQAKIERQKKRIENKWDQRSLQQRKNDRRVLVFLIISAGILVNSVAVKE